MFDPTSIIGQWAGHFEYGPEYGHLDGEKVQFRLYIDLFIDGQFSGKCADLEGVGSNFEIAKIKGFVGEDFISFTKEYAHFHGFDENGNSIVDETQMHPVIHYEGYYKRNSGIFSGRWEMERDIQQIGDKWLVEVNSGKWDIIKDD